MEKLNFKSEYDLSIFLLESNLVKTLPTLLCVCNDYFNHIRALETDLVIKAWNDNQVRLRAKELREQRDGEEITRYMGG
jgi:hypothetical protein